MTTAVSNICRYMVDAADHEKLDAAKNELHSLLDKPQLTGIPVSENKQVICCDLWQVLSLFLVIQLASGHQMLFIFTQ